MLYRLAATAVQKKDVSYSDWLLQKCRRWKNVLCIAREMQRMAVTETAIGVQRCFLNRLLPGCKEESVTEIATEECLSKKGVCHRDCHRSAK